MKTLADLKRDAQSGKIKLEIVERYGETGEAIPERLRGIRQVVRANSVAIFLLNADGRESEMRIENAKLVEYDGQTLTVYNPGRREPTEEEQKTLDGADEIRKNKVNSYDCGYWAVKSYFDKSACPWMAGYEKISGKKYETWSKNVVDWSIKGDPILKYKVYQA